MTAARKLTPRSQAAWDLFREQVSQLGGYVIEPNWRGAIADLNGPSSQHYAKPGRHPSVEPNTSPPGPSA